MQKINDAVYAVDADGVLITAVGVGSKDKVVIKSENPELVRLATTAADACTPVEVVYNAEPILSGWDTEIAVLAALMSAAPGRTYIREAPQAAMEEVWALAGNDEGVIY